MGDADGSVRVADRHIRHSLDTTPDLGRSRTADLVLGTATLGNLGAPMTDRVASDIMRAAREAGIAWFDTAPQYGLGLSETRLGEELRGVGRETYMLSTKVGRLLVDDPRVVPGEHWGDFHVSTRLRPVWDFSPDGIRRSLEGSLDRLKTDRVDVAFLHDPHLAPDDRAVPHGVGALQRLRDEGTVGAVGVACKELDVLASALDIGGVDILMIPGRLNLLDGSAVAIARRAQSMGVEIWNAAPFAAGALAGAALPTSGYGSLSARDARALTRVRRVCLQFSVPIVAAALQFAAGLPGVSRVVVGAMSATQIIESVASMKVEIPEELWGRLASHGGDDS